MTYPKFIIAHIKDTEGFVPEQWAPLTFDFKFPLVKSELAGRYWRFRNGTTRYSGWWDAI
jgi:hypothetical protein